MEKGKAYCPECQKEMTWNVGTELFDYQCDCYSNRRFDYILYWCEECQNFTQRRGRKINACNRCAVRLQHKTMAENDPEGYSARQSAATRKANERMKAEGKGVWDPKVHLLMEETKKKNGTSLSNQEFRKKIGCNGNPQYAIDKQKELGIGIFRNDIRNNHLPGNCTKCGKYCESRNAFGLGVECGCLNKLGFQPNFVTRNGIRFYKEKHLETLCNQLLNGEEKISDYPGFSIRFDKVCYHGVDVLTDEKLPLNGDNFTIRNNVEYAFDHSTGEYVPKKEFFDRFQKYVETVQVSKKIQQLLDEGFELEPVVKINDEMWNRLQTDKMLHEKGYGWFVYVKLFNGLPFIVGKTGTYGARYDDGTTKQSMIDWDFRVYNPEDLKDPDYAGQGRRFLQERHSGVKYTDFDHVLCKKCENEQEAYKVEKEIGEKYHLFYS